MQDSSEKQIEAVFNNIEALMNQKPFSKNIENEVNKELKKIRHLIKGQISEQYKNKTLMKQKKLRENLEKIKPKYLTPEQKVASREEVIIMIKQLEKKLAALDQKKGKKRISHHIEYFKQHIDKLSMFADWLNCPSRKFHYETTQQFLSKIKQLPHFSDNALFQQQISQIYKKMIASANQPVELSHSQFISSFKNRPCLNDYLVTKQTKQILHRNSLLPQYRMIDLGIIPKMEKQVLFFMFYFHKGETQQYLAAKQLMKRSWRFYKKFNVWLRRNSNPTFEGADYETGKYISMNSEMNSKQRVNIKVYHNFLLKSL